MGFNKQVRLALQKARETAAKQAGRVPKLDAVVAVLNADNIDRDAGRTGDNEVTPGAQLAVLITR